jgi:hypothetical protein
MDCTPSTDAPLPGTEAVAAGAATVFSEGPTISTSFGPGGTTTTDTVPDDGGPEQIVVTAPRPASSTAWPRAAPDTAPPAEPSRHSGFRWPDLWPISSAQAQEEAEKDPITGREDEGLEEILRENDDKLDRDWRFRDREIRKEKADFPTADGNEQLRKATEPKPEESPLLPIPDSYASRLAPLRGPPAAPTEPAPRAGASGTAAATATEETSPAPRLPRNTRRDWTKAMRIGQNLYQP